MGWSRSGFAAFALAIVVTPVCAQPSTGSRQSARHGSSEAAGTLTPARLKVLAEKVAATGTTVPITNANSYAAWAAIGMTQGEVSNLREIAFKDSSNIVHLYDQLPDGRVIVLMRLEPGKGAFAYRFDAQLKPVSAISVKDGVHPIPLPDARAGGGDEIKYWAEVADGIAVGLTGKD